MIDIIITTLVSLVIGCIGFFLSEQHKEVKALKSEVNSVKQELMKRAEVIEYVGAEIVKLRLELKDDNDKVMDLILRLDEKIDKIYTVIVRVVSKHD